MYLILCVLLRCISSGFTSKMSSRALKRLRGETFELLFVNKKVFIQHWKHILCSVRLNLWASMCTNSVQ